MILDNAESLCERDQKIIVSKDEKTQRRHRAVNEKQKSQVRHFKLDGVLLTNEKSCDFLLINDTKKKAYCIELKGRNITDAIPQLEAGEQFCKKELPDYEVHFRLICSKARTHEINTPNYRRFKEKNRNRFICATDNYEEKI